MQTLSSASRTWAAWASASEYTATEAMPSRRSVRMTRQAISPRLAISTFENRGINGNSLAGSASEPRAFRETGSVPDQQLNWVRIVRVARVVELRAIRDQANHIHLRTHLDVPTAGADAVLKGE